MEKEHNNQTETGNEPRSGNATDTEINTATTQALLKIKQANPNETDPKQTLGFIKTIWSEQGKWKEKETKKGTLYTLTPNSIVGNQAIIEALKDNQNEFWETFKTKSKRDGQYKILVPYKKKSTQKNKNIKDKSLRKKDRKSVEWIIKEISMLATKKDAWKKMFEEQCKKTANLELEIFKLKNLIKQ